MAKNTDTALRNMVIYEVFVRNHSIEGSFKGVIKDLDRIKELGVDYIWLMPINPIGDEKRKGSLGSPYAIKDYGAINSELGSLEDFKELIKATHDRGLRIMLDVVYNHTSPDSLYVKEHPEVFYRRENGSLGNRVGDWSDIVDLDYSHEELWKLQLDNLKYWVSLGVDGFRCDVAPLVPIEFWEKARREIAAIKEDFIWLSESVEGNFIRLLRKEGVTAHSDSEMYRAFDITYDYDVYRYFEGYLEGKNTLKDYVDKVDMQEYIYPNNYVKLRFLENHDRERITDLLKDEHLLKIWTAFLYFQKGAVLLYGGQEALDEKRPDLFNRDNVNWQGLSKNLSLYLNKLYQLKKDEIFSRGSYRIYVCEEKDVIIGEYTLDNRRIIGVFNIGKEEGFIPLKVKGGYYRDLLEGEVMIREDKLLLQNEPIIIEVEM